MSATLHPNAVHVADTLISRGHPGLILTQPESVHTAEQAAAALGVDIGAIVKSLVFELDGEPVLLLVSGATGSTSGAAASASAERWCRRPPNWSRRSPRNRSAVSRRWASDQSATYVDRDLEAHPLLWAAGGHPNTVFRTTYRELLRITAGMDVKMD